MMAIKSPYIPVFIFTIKFLPAKLENNLHIRRKRPTCTICIYNTVLASKKGEKPLVPQYGLQKLNKKFDIQGGIDPPIAAATTAPFFC